MTDNRRERIALEYFRLRDKGLRAKEAYHALKDKAQGKTWRTFQRWARKFGIEN